jgi:hypothetical protein
MGLHSRNGNGHGTVTILPPPPPPPRTILGAGIAHRHLDARQRACLAADAYDQLAVLIPSITQLAIFFTVSVPYIRTALKLSPARRAAILAGQDATSFAGLMNPPKQMSLLGPVLPTTKMITDADLEQMIRAVGLERALAAAIVVEHNT